MHSLSQKRVSADALKAFCVEALLRAGMSESPATVTAEVLVTTDTWGIHTPELTIFSITYVKSCSLTPRRFRRSPLRAVAHDGHCAIAMVTSCMAMRPRSARRRIPESVAGVRNSNHSAPQLLRQHGLEHEMIGWRLRTPTCQTAQVREAL
jgi:LDH2 family malate/lactate/ureidoglycolate dehydrogenase